MVSPSSTFSSSPAADLTSARAASYVDRWTLTRVSRGSFLRKLPAGGGAACLWVALIHGVISIGIFPQPVAREEIRDRVIAVTRDHRPSIVIAGDSRAAWQLIPEALSVVLSARPQDAVNIALKNSGTAPVAAVFRELGHRFAPSPIVVLSVSIWSVNDRTPAFADDDEILWSLSWLDRLRLVGPARAMQTAFLAERRLWQRAGSLLTLQPAEASNREFFGHEAGPAERFTPEGIQRQIDFLNSTWYARPKLDGIRWRRMEADLQSLVDAGVQVVLFDGPQHPALGAGIAGTAAGRADDLFHRRLAVLAKRLNILILRYQDDWYDNEDAADIYYDVMHVTRRGAEILSARVGQDLKSAIDRAVLRMPPDHES